MKIFPPKYSKQRPYFEVRVYQNRSAFRITSNILNTMMNSYAMKHQPPYYEVLLLLLLLYLSSTSSTSITTTTSSTINDCITGNNENIITATFSNNTITSPP